MPERRPIRLFLADDHAVLRAGLTLLLNAQSDMTVVGEAADGGEVCARAPAVNPDVILLDITMPGPPALHTARRLQHLLPAARLVILTQHDDKGYLRKFLEAGCSGYVLKKSADRELIAAIRAVMAGDTYICPSMSQAVLQRYVRQATGQPEPREEAAPELTPREREVVSLVAQGYTNKELADQLFISVKTVETHKRRVMKKLGFSRRAQLVRYALDKGLMRSPGGA